MTLQLVTTSSENYHLYLVSTEDEQVQPRHWPIIIRLTMVVWVCLMVCITAVVVLSRMGASPLPVLQHQGLLPGDSLPANATCDEPLSLSMTCRIIQGENTLAFAYDAVSQSIVRTTILMYHQTIRNPTFLLAETPS